MVSKKALIVGGGGAYERMFLLYGWEVVDDIHEADLLVFTGGSDVSPSFYGEDIHPSTSAYYHRDVKEREIFMIALDLGIPTAGICRGGQFLNVMNEGKMYQHVDGHAVSGTHNATDVKTGRTVQVSSTHHQMMRPSPTGEVLCVAAKSSYKEHMVAGEVCRIDGTEENDVEVVLYRGTRSLCFQPHPEFVAHSPAYRECADYFFECLKEIV